MRKEPQQRRSREMVHRIVGAGRAVLAEEGYDACSTNRIATRAGVSPGSVYQYFPDKAAIVAAVIDGWSEETSERVAAALADRLGERDPIAMVRATVDALLAALEADPELLRVVSEELPVAVHKGRRAALERRVRELTAAWLTVRPGSTTISDPGTSAWLLVLTLEQLAVRWVLDRPPIAREQLVEEIVVLVSGYLAAPRAG
jgi:AcrR family transcriptional regulator